MELFSSCTYIYQGNPFVYFIKAGKVIYSFEAELGQHMRIYENMRYINIEQIHTYIDCELVQLISSCSNSRPLRSSQYYQLQTAAQRMACHFLQFIQSRYFGQFNCQIVEVCLSKTHDRKQKSLRRRYFGADARRFLNCDFGHVVGLGTHGLSATSIVSSSIDP